MKQRNKSPRSTKNGGKSRKFHKSLMSNAGLAISPTRTVTTQNNHIFMSIYVLFKLECLKIKRKANYFVLWVKHFHKGEPDGL
ncbi:MAG: hypothetical protein WAV82_08720 [Methylobacter sp.]